MPRNMRAMTDTFLSPERSKWAPLIRETREAQFVCGPPAPAARRLASRCNLNILPLRRPLHCRRLRLAISMVMCGPNPPSTTTVCLHGHPPSPLARVTAPASEALLARAERLAARRNLNRLPDQRSVRGRRLRLAISMVMCGPNPPSTTTVCLHGHPPSPLARVTAPASEALLARAARRAPRGTP